MSNEGSIRINCRCPKTVPGLNARLNIKDAGRQGGGPDKVPITKDLLKAEHSASRTYKEHLIEGEKAKEEELRRKEEEEHEKQRREQEMKDQEVRRKPITQLQEELEEKQKEFEDERKAADSLINEVLQKLPAALKKKDLEAAKVTRACLKGPRTCRIERHLGQKEHFSAKQLGKKDHFPFRKDV